MEVLHPSPTPTVPPPIRQNREWTSGFGKERDKKSVLSKCLLVVVWPCGLRRGPPR